MQWDKYSDTALIGAMGAMEKAKMSVNDGSNFTDTEKGQIREILQSWANEIGREGMKRPGIVSRAQQAVRDMEAGIKAESDKEG